MKKYFVWAWVPVLLFLAPSVSFAAPLTQTQAESLISVVQASPSTPASAFTNLITAFSNITVAQAESLIGVVQAAPGVSATSFVNLLIAFTQDTQAVVTTTTPDTTAQCAQYYTGTYPNCVALQCPSGYTGSYPNCVAPTQTSVSTPIATFLGVTAIDPKILIEEGQGALQTNLNVDNIPSAGMEINCGNPTAYFYPVVTDQNGNIVQNYGSPVYFINPETGATSSPISAYDDASGKFIGSGAYVYTPHATSTTEVVKYSSSNLSGVFYLNIGPQECPNN
jgi:hypothetical protein